jgi:hypothetical protein
MISALSRLGSPRRRESVRIRHSPTPEVWAIIRMLFREAHCVRNASSESTFRFDCGLSEATSARVCIFDSPRVKRSGHDGLNILPNSDRFAFRLRHEPEEEPLPTGAAVEFGGRSSYTVRLQVVRVSRASLSGVSRAHYSARVYSSPKLQRRFSWYVFRFATLGEVRGPLRVPQNSIPSSLQCRGTIQRSSSGLQCRPST